MKKSGAAITERTMKRVTYSELDGLIGETLFSDWISVPQGKIDLFAEATDDHQWIHTDVERATRERGQTIAHGFLTLSLLSALLAKTLEIGGVAQSLNYGLNKVRFLMPLPAGGRVRLKDTIQSVTSRSGGKLVQHGCEIEIEGADGPAVVAEWLTLHQPQ
jgi:acyl dehydratase